MLTIDASLHHTYKYLLSPIHRQATLDTLQLMIALNRIRHSTLYVAVTARIIRHCCVKGLVVIHVDRLLLIGSLADPSCYLGTLIHQQRSQGYEDQYPEGRVAHLIAVLVEHEYAVKATTE